MNDLDRIWSEKLAEAMRSAREAGRGDAADYLALRAANDAIRTAAVEWLIESFIDLAMQESRIRPSIAVERDEPHSFGYRGANVVGTRLTIKLGVRCLSVEAGWTRTPADGFMRGGALAAARISHFGIPKATMDLILSPNGDDPAWEFISGDNAAGVFGIDEAMRHMSLLTD